MATAQTFVGTPKAAQVNVPTANTARDGTGALGTLHTAGSGGARFDRLDIKAAVTTTAGTIRLFRSTDGGTTKRLWKEIPVTAITASATVPAFQYTERDLGLVMQASEIIYASNEKSESINVYLSEGGDF